MFDYTQDYSLNLEVRESLGSRVVGFDMPLSDESSIHVYVSADSKPLDNNHNCPLSDSLLLAGLGLLAISGRRRYYRTR